MKNMSLIKDFNEKELRTLCDDLGYPRFHGTQVFKWLYQKKCDKYQDMSNIPKDLIAYFKKNYSINALTIFKNKKSNMDETIKFLLKTKDNKFIETVSMIDEKHHTVCI